MLSTTLLLAASMVVGQADGEEAFESYSELVVGGTWTTTDANGVVIEDCYREILDGKFLQFTTTRPNIVVMSVIGVDPKTKKCTWWAFTNQGGTGVTTMTLESPGVWMIDMQGNGPKGEYQAKSRSTRKDANTIETKMLEGSYGGDPLPLETTVWKRKP